jgi:hypothetical protein
MVVLTQVGSAPSRLQSGVMSWHLGASACKGAFRFRGGPMSVVLSGTEGLRAAKQLQASGQDMEWRVDPGGYSAAPPDHAGTLFHMEPDWAALQRGAGVAEVLSPGVYVPAGEPGPLLRALESEQCWAEKAGGATVQLALDWRWLVDGLDALLAALEEADGPVALLLAAAKDPLSHAGAVAGLAQVVSAHPTIAVHRCDIGALGLVALGGRHGVIGIDPSQRHIYPPSDGRAFSQDRSPAVFVPELLGWHKGTWLARMAASDRHGRLCCHLPACDGRPYRTFRDPSTRPDAVAHNRHAIEPLVTEVLGTSPEERFGVFRSLCDNAIAAAFELSGELRQDISPSPQVQAWARL